MTMAKNWSQVRAEAEPLLDPQRVKNAKKQLDEQGRAYRLAEVRRRQGENQVDVAKRMKVSQSRLSRIERGDLSHTELGTLQSYVEALGGEFEVTATFGDESIRLN
jgi:DNA-binding XRE family transcriptional regulator